MKTLGPHVATVLMFTASAIMFLQADGQRSQERTIYFQSGVPIASQLQPTDQVVIVEKVTSPPPIRTGRLPPLTEEINSVRKTADAIVLLEVQQVEGKLTPDGDWIRTEIRSVVKDVVKAPARPLGTDKHLNFEFDGGEMRLQKALVRAGRYPVLRAGSTYLLQFQLDPTVGTWYPYQPFLVDASGFLARSEVFDPSGAPLRSPLYGQSAQKVIALLKQ